MMRSHEKSVTIKKSLPSLVNYRIRKKLVFYGLKGIDEAFIEMSHDLGMSQVVNQPTRRQIILDRCLTSFPHLINKCQVLAALDDHEIVRILASIRPLRKKLVNYNPRSDA